LEMICL